MSDQNIVEFVSSRGARLEVGNGGGVIRGVKVLGMESSNGRRYPRATLERALPLYADAKVNVNHPEKNPTDPRRYQDRLGMIRDPVLREDGIYGDLFYNPNHAIAKQLEWDAEHAPENVGLSHNVAARLTDGGKVVESITKVLGVDLVADPATTRGLFENLDPKEQDDMNISEVTLEKLREEAPELVKAIETAAIAESSDSTELEKVKASIATLHAEQAAVKTELQTVKEERDALTAEKTAKAKHDAIEAVLAESKLPEDILTEAVQKQAHSYDKADGAKAYIQTIVEAVQKAASKPQSVEQMAADGKGAANEVKDGKTLVEAVTVQ